MLGVELLYTRSEIITRIREIDAIIVGALPVQSSSFSDQAATFRSLADYQNERARWVRMLDQYDRGGSTRYVATSKGC